MSNRKKINLAKLARVLARDLQRTHGDNVNREQLNAQHRDAITRNWRVMDDRGGAVPQKLLDDLAAIADAHAIGEGRAAVDRVLAARETAGSPAASGTSQEDSSPDVSEDVPARRTRKAAAP